MLDERIHAYRSDLADVALAGELFAPHYARPLVKSCGMHPAQVRAAPSDTAEVVSELLPGEQFAMLDATAGWGWGYCRLDHRVGYVRVIELVDRADPTHVVVEASAPIETGPDLLDPIISTLPMGSLVKGRETGALLAIEGGFVPLSHLRHVGEYEDDPVCVAQRLLGTPYLPGGRTLHGIDCSGLVQLALSLCGMPIPRDADHQRSFGEALPENAPLARGDLVFCDNHVGMMVDDLMVIHVSPASGKVAVEPLKAARASEGCSQITRRRLRR